LHGSGPTPPDLDTAATESIRPAAELAIVVPTYNERANIGPLIERLRAALAACDWEVIVVDDNSPDGTAAAVRDLAAHDRRVRCICRIGRRGLAGACLEGMLATQARYVAVIDADLQHDETLLLPMLQRLRRGDVNLVIASRYMAAEQHAGFGPRRSQISRLATRIARTVIAADITDPMSGFFMIRRDTIERLAPALSPEGFKILFDIVATARGQLTVAELPFVFRARAQGQSKLDARIAIDYVALVISKLTGNAISFRFMLFCFVGLTGVGIHMALLQLTLVASGVRFAIAQTVATVGAIGWNFALNNLVTYRDQRLAGWRFLNGLLRFQVICGIGAISNVGIASWIYGYNSNWWLAGLSGALLGAVWNYMASAAWVWRR
jgi:dolichol-phosphate mannosyltransferase